MTTNQSRPLPDYAGIRSFHRARSTRTDVGVYDGIEAGMDTEAGRWQTVCEVHHHVISHLTIHLARAHAAHPEDWCEECMKAQ